MYERKCAEVAANLQSQRASGENRLTFIVVAGTVVRVYQKCAYIFELFALCSTCYMYPKIAVAESLVLCFSIRTAIDQPSSALRQTRNSPSPEIPLANAAKAQSMLEFQI